MNYHDSRPQHVIHDSYGSYRARRSLKSNFEGMLLGVVLIIGGAIFMTYSFSIGLSFGIIGAVTFYFCRKFAREDDEELRHRKNAPLMRIGYD